MRIRHSVIEKMFREQYCLRDCDRVDVKFIVEVDGVSDFLIEDYVTYHGHTTVRKSILKIGVVNQKIEYID